LEEAPAEVPFLLQDDRRDQEPNRQRPTRDSTSCALDLAEEWIGEANNRCELSNAAHIYSDLDDLIDRAAQETRRTT
jgi:hypothetical protein